MTPAFEVTAEGSDITPLIADRLLGLTVTDEEGGEADLLELRLDDRDARLELPATGAVLTVALGFRGAALAQMGRFVVNGLDGTGPERTLVIRAEPADMATSIRAPRTRAWRDRSLSGIVEAIAGEAGLAPFVSEGLRSAAWRYLAQTAESDLHFLTRIGRDLDAVVKPAGGRLVVSRRGEADAPAPVIDASHLSEWGWGRGERQVYRSVEAEWGDVEGGEPRLVRRGEGEPARRLRHVYPTREEALRSCEAALAMADREALTCEALIAGFEPDLFAGGPVELRGLRPELDGAWRVQSVTHVLEGEESLATSFRAQRAAPEPA